MPLEATLPFEISFQNSRAHWVPLRNNAHTAAQVSYATGGAQHLPDLDEFPNVM